RPRRGHPPLEGEGRAEGAGWGDGGWGSAWSATPPRLSPLADPPPGGAGRRRACRRAYFLPWRSLSWAQKASTFDWSMMAVGMIISFSAGTQDLSPSREFAMFFMP